MLVHRRVKLVPSIKFAGTHLYTWVERGIVRVKCLAHEHNTMSPARARTRTACFRVKRNNHEATAPPTGTLTNGLTQSLKRKPSTVNTIYPSCLHSDLQFPQTYKYMYATTTEEKFINNKDLLKSQIYVLSKLS